MADAFAATFVASRVISGAPVNGPSVKPLMNTGVVIGGNAEASAMVAAPPIAKLITSLFVFGSRLSYFWTFPPGKVTSLTDPSS